MSALMALRAWAAGRLEAGVPVREVADDVLQAWHQPGVRGGGGPRR
jgi:hypothetical protein